MSQSTFSLGQLGWRPAFAQQLSLEDLESACPGRIAAVHRGGASVLCELGALYIPTALELAVGDWALIERDAPRIRRVLARSSLLARLAAGDVRRRQLIAANLDTLFVVASCDQDFNLSRLERYLVLARDAGVQPVLLLSKADLCEQPHAYVERARSIAGDAHVLAMDVRSDEIRGELSSWLTPGQTVAFVGSSGVGKSTLVNTLAVEAHQATRGTREHDGKGRHTTTSRQMFPAHNGAWIIDTPGMRELKIGAVESALATVFDELETLALHCRYRDCSHVQEQGCAVLEAVARGALDPRRLANYQKLRREAANAAQSVRERREHDRRVGRMHREVLRTQRRHKGRD